MMGEASLVLQRHFRGWCPSFVVRPPRVGVAVASPAGPSEMEALLLGRVDQHMQQAPHLRDGQRNQVTGAPFFAATCAAARVMSRKACATRQSVICRYQASQRRTSY